MDLFDTINAYLLNHPWLIAQMALLFRLKFWILLAMAAYFMTLPYRHNKKEQAKLAALKPKDGCFWA